MRRREFITLIGGAAAWPLAARAQQPERVRRIGVLMAYSESDREGQADVAAFRQELQRLGWIEGRNLRIDSRWAALDAEAMERFAKELVALRPDLIFSLISSTNASAQRAMSTASSRAISWPTCRCKRRPSTNWRSTSRPPRRSASRCHRRCSPAPTR
jgi:hypothetical protein